MADILLLEPGYKNKYPPLGLMKIASFHKFVHKDYVRFAKGKLPEALKDKKWDRVYVTTLFTFEWENTKKAIEYAYSVVKDDTQVYVGGILATLMPDLVLKTFPKIVLNKGLLNRKGTLGLEKEECIDTMMPDYGILDDIKDEYVYPANNAYYTYMTRGCGMKCEFCAVQTLEPDYIPYLSIKDAIRGIEERYGPKKDLLLMDNNVLRSKEFDRIIDEIKELGFAKGATYKNPKTGKIVQRFVDFNQGLDAYLMTPYKAKRLGEIAIRPARIAFDHIEDVEAYKKAIRLCAENGITHMSNYLLYNGVEFKGKGRNYHADTPEDLYERMKISLDLCDELTNELGYEVTIFSFPMRYIPLSDTKRGYVGTNWNAKYLRSLQRMLIPTQGKGVNSRSFFEACFGRTKEEFVEFLAMPEDILAVRGHFVEKTNEDKKERAARYQIWMKNQEMISNWISLYRGLGEKQADLIKLISTNNYSPEHFETIFDKELRKVFLFYMTIPAIMRIFNLSNEELKAEVFSLISNDYPDIYKNLVAHLGRTKLSPSYLEGIYRFDSKKIVKDLFNNINFECNEQSFVISSLEKVQKKTKIFTFNYELIKIYSIFYEAGVLSKQECRDAQVAIRNLDSQKLRNLLKAKMTKFEKSVKKKIDNEVAEELLVKEVQASLDEIWQQLSIFED